MSETETKLIINAVEFETSPSRLLIVSYRLEHQRELDFLICFAKTSIIFKWKSFRFFFFFSNFVFTICCTAKPYGTLFTFIDICLFVFYFCIVDFFSNAGGDVTNQSFWMNTGNNILKFLATVTLNKGK